MQFQRLEGQIVHWTLTVTGRDLLRWGSAAFLLAAGVLGGDSHPSSRSAAAAIPSAFTSAVRSRSASDADRPVVWMDDFLGVTVDPRYAQSLVGSGAMGLAGDDAVGGVLRLGAGDQGGGAARLRLGEEPGSGLYNVRNFSVGKNVVLEARVLLPQLTDAAATIGFVGLDDDRHSLALIYNHQVSGQWGFQGHNRTGASFITRPVGADIETNRWFTVRIVTSTEPTPSATLFIDGMAVSTLTGDEVPAQPLCVELQVWNQFGAAGRWSNTALLVGYLRVEQDR